MSRLQAVIKAAVIGFVSFHLLAAGSCATAFNNEITKADAAITKTNLAIAANKDIFNNGCDKGQLIHDEIVAQLRAGTLIMSAKDQANELNSYSTGKAVCDKGAPTTLSQLLAIIPQVTAWVGALSKWIGGVPA